VFSPFAGYNARNIEVGSLISQAAAALALNGNDSFKADDTGSGTTRRAQCAANSGGLFQIAGSIRFAFHQLPQTLSGNIKADRRK